MNFKDAKALRDEIREAGLHCTVRRDAEGHRATIYTSRGSTTVAPLSFGSRGEWLEWKAAADREDADKMRELLQPSRPRTPIEIMIDRACGVSA